MNKAIEILKQADDIVILPHVKPDGDALGSSFALMQGLKQLGKTVYVVIEEDEIPPRYAFMTYGYEKVPQDFTPKLVVALDSGEEKMLGDRRERYPHIHLSMDHHRSNEGFGDYSYLDATASATGEIIFDVLKGLEATFTKEIAQCLYVSIASDTGCMKFSNTTGKTYAMVGQLWDVYGSFDKINHMLFSMVSRRELAIEKLIKDTLEFSEDEKIASIVITQQMREATGATDDDVGGFAGFPRRIEGVDVGITYKECEKAGWRISMRSNDLVDVSVVCKALGGGGHMRASGCQIEKPLEETKALVMKEVEKVLYKK